MTKGKTRKTNRIFSRTSAIIGMGSLLNISGNYFDINYSTSDNDADIKAVESDWYMIGKDIEDAINKTIVCS